MAHDPWPIDDDRHYAPLPEEEIGDLVDGDFALRLRTANPARPDERWAAEYVFDMVTLPAGEKAGGIRLRLADTEELVFYGGHIGYAVDEAYRGRRYSARAVGLLLPLAARIGMKTVWITCDPDNVASRRSIELAGGKFVEGITIPPTSPMYAKGRRRSYRYRFDL